MLKYSELKKCFDGKKVLITGHTGFKGSYMCILLKNLGAKIYGYALKPEKGSLYDIITTPNVTPVGANACGALVEDEVFADIRDYKKLFNFIKKVKPDYVIHMAAQALVLTGYEKPLYTYEVNAIGTANLLEAIRIVYKNAKKPVSVLNVTTDKVYENNDLSDYAFKEEDKLCGRDPYANSKSCSEIITYAYNKSFFTDKKIYRISTVRAGNVIGGGDFSKDRIIPDCYRAIKSKKNLVLRNPHSIRPYQFVLEPIIIYLNIIALQMKDKKYEGNYNVGPDKDECLTTKELVDKFFKSWEKQFGRIDIKTIIKKSKNAHEASFLRLDNSLIKKKLGYKKIFDIDKAIDYTVRIYHDIMRAR